MTVSKELFKGVGVYVGASYSEFEQRVLIPAGASFQFDENWSSLMVYDGVNFHPMVTYGWDRYSITFLMALTRDPGINFTAGF